MKAFSRFPVLLALTALVFVVPAAEQPAEVDPRFRLPDSDAGISGAGPIRRYDWFRKLWEERRSEWGKRVQDDQNALVFVGDSITQGWGNHLGENFPGVKIANRGISGDTSENDEICAVYGIKAAGLIPDTGDKE